MLGYLDQNLTSVIVNRPSNNLAKPPGADQYVGVLCHGRAFAGPVAVGPKFEGITLALLRVCKMGMPEHGMKLSMQYDFAGQGTIR